MKTYIDDEQKIYAEVYKDNVLLMTENEDNIEMTVILTLDNFRRLVNFVNKQTDNLENDIIDKIVF